MDDLTGVVLDDRYRVIEPISEGAMGVVYRAERLKLGRVVAIKVMHDQLPAELASRKRFEIEATAMAKLEHPHCAAVIDVGIHDNMPFVVMDYVAGETLRDIVAAGPLPLPRAVEIVRQVLSGLAHAHEQGIIHRDIKPANIVVSQKSGLGDHVKILDFGLARITDSPNVTTGIVVGTPAYMAPEQIRGTVIDHRADLYSAGVLLFELLTGKKPFVSPKDDPIEICSMHLKQAPPTLQAMQPGIEYGALEGLVAKALAKPADDRFSTAVEFAAALDAVVPRRASAPVIPIPAVATESGWLVPGSAPVPVPMVSSGPTVPTGVATGPTAAASDEARATAVAPNAAIPVVPMVGAPMIGGATGTTGAASAAGTAAAPGVGSPSMEGAPSAPSSSGTSGPSVGRVATGQVAPMQGPTVGRVATGQVAPMQGPSVGRVATGAIAPRQAAPAQVAPGGPPISAGADSVPAQPAVGRVATGQVAPQQPAVGRVATGQVAPIPGSQQPAVGRVATGQVAPGPASEPPRPARTTKAPPTPFGSRTKAPTIKPAFNPNAALATAAAAAESVEHAKPPAAVPGLPADFDLSVAIPRGGASEKGLDPHFDLSTAIPSPNVAEKALETTMLPSEAVEPDLKGATKLGLGTIEKPEPRPPVVPDNPAHDATSFFAGAPPAGPSPLDVADVPAVAEAVALPPPPMLPSLPVTRKQIQIIGIAAGALLLLAIVIGTCSGGKSTGKPTDPTKTKPTKAEAPAAEPARDPADEAFVRTSSLVEDGKAKAAIDPLQEARKQFPKDPRFSYLLGRAYFETRQGALGLKQFRDTLALDGTYRADPDLIRAVVRAFTAAAEYPAELGTFLQEIGAPARQYLEEVAAKHSSPKIRNRAKAELAKL